MVFAGEIRTELYSAQLADDDVVCKRDVQHFGQVLLHRGAYSYAL
jgi:hypothetical protein